MDKHSSRALYLYNENNLENFTIKPFSFCGALSHSNFFPPLDLGDDQIYPQYSLQLQSRKEGRQLAPSKRITSISSKMAVGHGGLVV